jgi:hypothetical membrane protein
MWGKKLNKKIKITKIAGICGILLPIVVFVSISLAMFGAPWFKWTNNALSDLGVGGISAFFFNNGLVIGGILAFIFSIGLIKILSNKIGGYALAVSSLALICVGLFPITIFELHYVSSVTFFAFLVLALFIVGVTLVKEQPKHGLGVIAIIFALLACSSPIFLNTLSGIAIPEAIVCFPAFIWCMTYGYKMRAYEQKGAAL